MVKKSMKLHRKKNGEAVSKKQVKAPVRWQSDPTHPTTHLAYITDAERELLAKLDMHGSGVSMQNPHYGPKGIPSLNGMGGPGGSADRGGGSSDGPSGGAGGIGGDRGGGGLGGSSGGRGGSSGGGGDGPSGGAGGIGGDRGGGGLGGSSGGGADRGGADRNGTGGMGPGGRGGTDGYGGRNTGGSADRSVGGGFSGGGGLSGLGNGGGNRGIGLGVGGLGAGLGGNSGIGLGRGISGGAANAGALGGLANAANIGMASVNSAAKGDMAATQAAGAAAALSGLGFGDQSVNSDRKGNALAPTGGLRSISGAPVGLGVPGIAGMMAQQVGSLPSTQSTANAVGQLAAFGGLSPGVNSPLGSMSPLDNAMPNRGIAADMGSAFGQPGISVANGFSGPSNAQMGSFGPRAGQTISNALAKGDLQMSSMGVQQQPNNIAKDDLAGYTTVSKTPGPLSNPNSIQATARRAAMANAMTPAPSRSPTARPSLAPAMSQIASRANIEPTVSPPPDSVNPDEYGPALLDQYSPQINQFAEALSNPMLGTLVGILSGGPGAPRDPNRGGGEDRAIYGLLNAMQSGGGGGGGSAPEKPDTARSVNWMPPGLLMRPNPFPAVWQNRNPWMGYS